MQAVATLEVMEAPTEVTLDSERSYEFVDGQWEVKEMPSAQHSGVCGRIFAKLVLYLVANPIGRLYPEASFQIGSRERVPDLAFLAVARIPLEGEPKTKWFIVPDIAIEVISPTDLVYKVREKLNDYLDAGVKQVWQVTPEDQTITIYRSHTNIIAFPDDSELVCEDLLPGFRCRLSDIFTPDAINP
ncbi:MAG: Uma2 family endonuclease [Acidobacteria bacterium]|nr:Uma2 family endonuclease [Acidobacteriota bacterium]